MSFDKAAARERIQKFDLSGLFTQELGWDWHTPTVPVSVAGRNFLLQAVAEKRGFVAWHCPTPTGEKLPDSALRRRIEREAAKAAHEHLIVFSDDARTMQIWQWVRREQGKSLRVRETLWTKGKSGEILLQKLDRLFMSFDDEENLTLLEVAGRAAANVDERVTKRFYEEFRKHHAAFLKFITGIPNQGDHEWYTSVMLNRLMFLYFVQRKGFLDGDRDYLRNRLNRVKTEEGPNKFYRFYRHFLLELFHKGLGGMQRTPELVKLLGRVPYLNGGIFDVHKLEKPKASDGYGEDIQIPDKAFDEIFDYFDEWQWHLDERPLREEKEINPDVLGYIFEKYINQKQMGAYYTKEDITEYIGKNTILPFLFDAVRGKVKGAFEGDASIWSHVKADPDRYIYKAVRHGLSWDYRPDHPERGEPLETERPLPSEIAAGLDAVRPNVLDRRKPWNRPAPASHGLPTEIWRETIARRQRYAELRKKLAAGEVHDISEFITLNLDGQRFALDVISRCDSPELLAAFWHVLAGKTPRAKSGKRPQPALTVLDPTCGSGAFLFAALNLLEPLYEACLDRMEGLLADARIAGTKLHSESHLAEFEEVLKQVERHPNERYFIFKTIILHNLYGVDIMEEAVEICKLRLFLKLAAQVEPDSGDVNLGIEPLPDIDFNIRAGNTLVGYATRAELEAVAEEDLLLSQEVKGVIEAAENAAAAYETFIQSQVAGENPSEFKRLLTERLKAAREQCDRFLADSYQMGVTKKAKHFADWKRRHQPFHWFVEFFGILDGGGFDVIIGNPPYVSAAKVRKEYAVKNFATATCSDIYAWVLERSELLLRDGGRSGMIVPLSLGFSSDFEVCRRLLLGAYSENWFSSFGRIPSALFSFDVRVRNTIHVGHKSQRLGKSHTTRLHRWFDAGRGALFQTMEYTPFKSELWKYRIPKLNTARLAEAFERELAADSHTLDTSTSSRATRHVLHFKKTAYNWLNFCRSMPPCYEGSQRVDHTKFGEIYFRDAVTTQLALLLANGKLMMIFWFAIADDFDVTRWNFADFPANLSQLTAMQRDALLAIAPKLEKAMENAVQFKLNAGRRVGNYNLAKCRDVTDESDRILAGALGFLEAWDDIELYYAQTMKTDFSTPKTEDSE